MFSFLGDKRNFSPTINALLASIVIDGSPGATTEVSGAFEPGVSVV
jgi:hypothetical protein